MQRPRLAAAVLLAVIVILSTVARILIGRDAPAPWVFVDELIFSELGRSAFDGFSIRGAPVRGYGDGYPVLIGPVYLLVDNLVWAYAGVKALNALVMSLTAVPVYVTARLIMGRRFALLAAGLSILVPAMAYTGVVMTENAFYPAFAAAVMAMAYALARRHPLWQVAVFAFIALAYLVRPQGAVLVGAYGVAVLLFAILALRAEPGSFGARLWALVRSLWVTVGVYAIGLVAAVAWVIAQNRSLSELLGAYAITTEMTERYTWRPVVSWFLLHIAELDLWVGMIPFAALLLLLVRALRRTASPELRALACVAVPVVLLMAAVVGAFVVFANVGRIEERNLFYVGIFPLVALCWWIANGMERPRFAFPIVLAVSTALPMAIPYGALINQTAVSDTFGLHLPWAIQNRLLDPTLVTFAVLVGLCVAAVLLVVIPRRAAAVLVAAVVAFFVLTGIAVDVKTDRASTGALQQGIGGERDWIDRAVGHENEVAVLYSGALEPLRVWQNEFFNRSVGSIYPLGVPLPGHLPEVVVNPDAEGVIVDLNGAPVATPPYVLVHDSTVVPGEVVARDDPAHMTLVRPEAPLRIAEEIYGLYDDGWTSGEVAYRRYRCTEAGRVETTVRLDRFLHAGPVAVTPIVGDVDQASVEVPPDGAVVAIAVPVEPVDGICAVRFRMDPLAIPAEVVGSTDTRSLGVLMDVPRFVAG